MAVNENRCDQRSDERQEKSREDQSPWFSERRKGRKHKQYYRYGAPRADYSGYQRAKKYQPESHSLRSFKAVVAGKSRLTSSSPEIVGQEYHSTSIRAFVAKTPAS